MDIHKPKPWRDWRELLTELAIVVLGVGLALAAQQAADWFHWRSEVAQAREVIATEIANSVRGAVLRVRTAPCVESRLDAVTDVLDQAARTGNLPPLGIIGQAPALLWPTGAWESVVASQTATHFPREQLANLARLYKQVERAESFNVAERQAWSTLYTMVGPGRRLDPSAEAQLRQALSVARLSNRMLLTSVAGLMAAAQEANLSFSQDDLDAIATAKRAAAGMSTEITGAGQVGISLALICGPIGPVPPRYGQSQNNFYSLTRYGEILKAVPDFGDRAKISSP